MKKEELHKERKMQNSLTNLKEKNNGITLIALVITIIVLLILAGVSIVTLTGENGILTKADKARTDTKNATEKEQIVLAYNAAMGNNDGKGVTLSDFESELKKYDSGITVTDDLENNNFKVTFPNENEYTVESNGKITGPTNTGGDNLNPSGEEKLAKKVLKVNPSGAEPYEKSTYVKYNNITCRVLYNDDKHGLQIISEDNVGKVTLGSRR